MDISYHSTVVFVKDIKKVRNFYQKVLGMQLEYDFGNNLMFKSGLSLWEVSNNHSIRKVVKASGKGENQFELYFETESMEEVQKQISTYTLEYLHDMIEEPWGQRTLRFYDPENNLVELAESLRGFVSRMKADGLSFDAISQKTGISIQDIKQILGKM